MKREPGLKDDAKNLSVVGGSALMAVLVTAGFLFARPAEKEQEVVRVHVIERVIAPTVEVEPVVAPEAAPEPVIVERVRAPLSGINRLYGTVSTRDGSQFTGFIRWDRNEGSWTDLLDANKQRTRGGESLSGVRFGHIERIEVIGRNSALFTLRSGDQVEMSGNATDLGSGLRALIIDEGDQTVQLDWRDLDVVDFMPPPPSERPNESRMFGTLTTRTGLEFTGYVTWDVDEIYSSDVLDGDLDGDRMKIPFGEIEAIERFSPRAAMVTLIDGQEMILDGTQDVNRSISGISVSDATLGQVKMGWDEFDRVVFHGTDDEASVSMFDGGERLFGTVVTRDGEELSGDITWDMDERFSWEMLDGDIRGLEFKVEFSQIEHIERIRGGVTVTLRDGRTFDLDGSNDVDSGNRGTEIDGPDGRYQISWSEFSELRLSN